MEVKKSQKANLEMGSSTRLLMGLVVALACLFVAFEWTSPKRVYQSVLADREEDSFEIIYRTDLTRNPEVDEYEWLSCVYKIVDNSYEIDEYKVVIPTDISAEDWAVKEQIEEMLRFPGGDYELFRYVSNNLRYPKDAESTGIEGDVICSFIINRSGRITECEIIQGLHPSLDKEAIRVVYNMPSWQPGRTTDSPISVKYYLPITFKLS